MNKLDGLGFETNVALCKCLHVEPSEFVRLVELCRSAYPYDCWSEPKKSGGRRLIENPQGDLKQLQVRCNRLFQRLKLPAWFHGCIAGTSIKTNAKPHCYKSWFLGLDIADYYLNIRPDKVYGAFRAWNASPDIARVLTTITTTRHHVPQGAPTSPIIAALAMTKMMQRIFDLVKSFGGRLTVFGDNIAISASRDLRRYQNTVTRIIQNEGFRLRSEKTIIVRPAVEKRLPGLVVRDQAITVADDDYSAVESLIERCLSFSEGTLSSRVCGRYIHRLNGLVNHYSWVDPKRMSSLCKKFSAIKWPEEYRRAPCLTAECHCM
jgi:RNA-directed DNA polymerase